MLYNTSMNTTITVNTILWCAVRSYSVLKSDKSREVNKEWSFILSYKMQYFILTFAFFFFLFTFCLLHKVLESVEGR